MLIATLILFPMLSAPVLWLLGRKRDRLPDVCGALCALAELALSLALFAHPQELAVSGILVSGLRFHTDGFRAVYSLITSLLWFGSSVFSMEYFRHEREDIGVLWAFLFLTLGAAQGVMLSSDYMTTYVFFEILSLSSLPWVIHERTREAIRAASTYLAVAVIGGLILFFGLLLLREEAGTLVYSELPGALAGADRGRVFAAAVCILLGFGAKAGMFPLHVWLPKAHPVAPAPASALLSGLLTKVGVFGILMTAQAVFPAEKSFGLLLLALGLITMALGAVLALASLNLKRTLACSSMSQIGFILTGISGMILNGAFGSPEGVSLAGSGVVLHMVNHSLLKLLLFLSAGAVAMNLHALDLNEIRGWGRNKPLLKLCFGVGALGISGVPLFNGYLSKTLLHEALVHAAESGGALTLPLRAAEWVFLISGGLTFAYMTKLYLCIFHERHSDPAVQQRYDADRRCMTPRSAAVLLCSAALVVVLGQSAAALRLSAVMTGGALQHFPAFAWENLKGAVISLSIGAAVYLCLVLRPLRGEGRYRNPLASCPDLEEQVYRPLLLRFLPALFGPLAVCLGENRLLRPLCRGIVLAASVVGRTLDSSTDALVFALRQTALREARVRDGRNYSRRRRMRAFGSSTGTAISHVLDNFSFAMMMTCAGIVLIFLLLLLLRGR